MSEPAPPPPARRSGYAGAVLGATLWMPLGAVMFASATPWLSAMLVGAFALAMAWGVWLWRQRASLSHRTIILRFVLGVGVITLILFVAAWALGYGAPLRLHNPDGSLGTGWSMLLVFPLVGFVLHRAHPAD